MYAGSRDSVLRLADGRRLQITQAGAPDGIPVLLFHGIGGSRLEALIVDDQARESGVRLIAPDRPGIGLSDPKSRFSYIVWPADVLQVADHLRLRRFGVAGLSGGALFALACA
jgi:pimeloyl-ACP methyl ester carboxylesterase